MELSVGNFRTPTFFPAAILTPPAARKPARKASSKGKARAKRPASDVESETGLRKHVFSTLRDFALFVVKEFAVPAIERQSAADFRAFIQNQLPEFARQLDSGASLLEALAKSPEALSRRSALTSEERLKKQAKELLGPAGEDSVDFACHVFGIAANHAKRTLASKAPETATSIDRELANQFHQSAVRYVFASTALLCSKIVSDLAAGVPEAAIEVMKESALAAHSSALEALRLREPDVEVDNSVATYEN